MNKSRLLLYLSVGFFLLGALLFYGTVMIEFDAKVAARGKSLLETAVHTADSVEISTLVSAKENSAQKHYRTKRFPEDYVITSTRQLSTEETREFLAILQRQVFDTLGGAGCHDPGYLLRFSRGGRTILTASLCLHCFNFEFEPFPFAPMWISVFDPDAKNFHLPALEAFLARNTKT